MEWEEGEEEGEGLPKMTGEKELEEEEKEGREREATFLFLSTFPLVTRPLSDIFLFFF